jgi:hypothetical protein
MLRRTLHSPEPMEVFYLEIRYVHIAAVVLSGALFFLRAIAGNVFGATRARTRDPLGAFSLL